MGEAENSNNDASLGVEPIQPRPGSGQASHRTAFLRYAKISFRILALIVVVLGVWQSIRTSTSELAKQQVELGERADQLVRSAESKPPDEAALLLDRARAMRLEASRFWQADPSMLCLASLFYACGMLPACLFWRRCLVELDQVHHLLDTCWAYFYGALGKYFPGKAMVIVLRVDSLQNHGVQKTTTAMTIFMETLTNMAVGGAVAAASLIWLDLDYRLSLLAVGLLVATAIPVSPPVLRFLLPKLQRGVPAAIVSSWKQRISWGLFLRGWLMLSVGWLLNGFGLMFVLQSLPSSQVAGSDGWTLYASATGACALAVVAGFLSLLPGGAGVREVVLSVVLSPVVGPVAALCAALWMRLVWIGTELLVVLVLLVPRTLGMTYQPAVAVGTEQGTRV
ncbi:MAG: lysylphosphatidylglycerol synthase domain-containing protein [Pirellulaceae bacterium]